MTKEEIYQRIAELLENYPKLRNNNAKLVKRFYRDVYNISVDEAIDKDGMISYSSVERYIRRVKQLYPRYKGHTDTEEKFKEIGLEVPIITRLL